MNEDVFVIGTGPSLLNLTKEEVDYVNSRPNICVNRYPLFWDLVGVIPTNYIHLDLNENTNSIIEGVLSKTKQFNNFHWITSSKHKKIIDDASKEDTSNIKFTFVDPERNRSKFIDKFEGRLFWCSILGAAINAINILYPSCDIKVLGMDGGALSHFWINDMVENKEKYSKEKFYKNHLEIAKQKQHNSMNMFSWGLKTIIKEVEKRNINIYNCNKASHWVEINKMKFKEINKK